MIEILLLGREHGYEPLRGVIEQALEWGFGYGWSAIYWR